MNFLDMRTVILTYAISNFICMVVMLILWLQNRKRFSGLGLWLADFGMQFIGVLLVVLRGIIPNLVSMTGSNLLIVGGTVLLLIGLERFTGKRGWQIQNFILLAVFTVVHAYLVVMYETSSLPARNIVFSLALLIVCSQCAWLLLDRVGPAFRAITRGVGHVFWGFSLVSVARIVVDLVIPSGNDFFHSNAYDTLLLVTYQMLFIVLTFSLSLMVNRRLFEDLDGDIRARKQAEDALHRQNGILEALQQTTLDLLSELDLDTLLENIVRRAGLLLGTTAGYIDLVEPGTGLLKPRVGLGALVESLDHAVQPGEGVAGTVWQTGEPLVVENYDTWSGRIRDFSSNKIHSIIGVPLISGGQVSGVLGLAHDAGSDRIFTHEDVDLLTQFARMVNIAIENARLFLAAQDELSERKRAEAIIRLRLRLWEYSTTHTVIELMQKALDEIEYLTHSSIGFYHLVNEDQNMLLLQAWSTATKAKFCKAEGEGMHYPIAEAGVWVDCVHQRKPVVHNDYASLPHRKGLPAGHAEVIRELVVPTMREDRVVSVLGIGNKLSEYDDGDIDLVVYIADVIWTIFEQKQAQEKIRQLNERLGHLAMTDDLTGLANRRSFFLKGNEEVKRAQRYKAPLSLIMADIDEFKKINDTFGHDIGDRTLQCVARTLQENIREIDMVARLGGEEFGVLLPNTTLEDAIQLGERLRSAIEQTICEQEGQGICVTISVGVTSHGAGRTTIDAILRDADTAMYLAKNQGRNRVVCME